jgi:hypothetical protein
MTSTSKKAVTKKRGRRAASRRRAVSAPVDLSNTPIDNITLQDLQPESLIAPHFRYYELSVSAIAARQGIDNSLPSQAVLHAAIHLAREVLEPIRQAFGGFTPNSVYRNQSLERTLKRKPSGWISHSQHTRGQACDIEIVALPTLELAQWAEKNLTTFDQIICECYDPAKGPNAGWVHISLLQEGAGTNRKQVISYVKDPQSRRMVYVEGLRATVA